MDEITEREIVEAAKAWWGLTWDDLCADTKWHLMWRTYAALRAARKVRG
jgi:hypothetical protein